MAISGFSSTLSLVMVSWSPSSAAISSSTGAIILHGPHHSAQKWTSTGADEPVTASSKVAVVRWLMPWAMSDPLDERTESVPSRTKQPVWLFRRASGLKHDARSGGVSIRPQSGLLDDREACEGGSR